MSHHTLFCRLAENDPGYAGALENTILTTIDFLNPDGLLKYGIGATLSQLSDLGLQPLDVAVDLVLIASAITAADTRINREANAQDHWTREIDLHVPVCDVALWRGQRDKLERMLRFLTGDHWRLFFRNREAAQVALTQRAQSLQIAFPTSVCLFSGGLDSFIGALDLLVEGEHPIFVSHWWDTLTRSRQTFCAEKIAERFPAGGHHHLQANIGFDHVTLSGSEPENTLRGRSFLFFAVAAMAASAIGGDITVHVPENGLISLNVPLDPLRLGALSTRTTHPFYMARFNELLSNLGITCHLQNRYRHMTKGKMVEKCKDQIFLLEMAKYTMSCSGPGKYRFHPDLSMRKQQHCGHCVPCLIRRAAMRQGFGIDGDETPYTLSNLEERIFDSSKAEGEHIRAYKLALARLENNPDRARRDIHIPGPLFDHSNELEAYVNVYVEGMYEVGRLLANVEARPTA